MMYRTITVNLRGYDFAPVSEKFCLTFDGEVDVTYHNIDPSDWKITSVDGQFNYSNESDPDVVLAPKDLAGFLLSELADNIINDAVYEAACERDCA